MVSRQSTGFCKQSITGSEKAPGLELPETAGVMNGVGGNKFGPQSPYTREQCVITMVKLANL